MALKAVEVFTPGAFPTHTYVERTADRIEQMLQDALATSGQIVSISGPSKSGKTVLVEKVVGRDNLITVTGAGIQESNDIWERVLDWMDAPHTQEIKSTSSEKISGEVEGEIDVQLPVIGGISSGIKGGAEVERGREKSKSYKRGGLNQVVSEIANSEYVILLDDFHYMPRTIQEEAAKILKEAVRIGVKICVAAVRHRGDDVVRANPELRGRVRAVDLSYWSIDELVQIGVSGFDALNIEMGHQHLRKLAEEAAGSPQLMQLICLNVCFVLNLREKLTIRKKVDIPIRELGNVFEQTSTSTDFRSLVDILDSGPRTRGTERKLYKLKDGSEGDVYRVILKAVASDPPRLSFDYDEITRRIHAMCAIDSPVGSSVVGTCLHMSRLAIEKFPNERAIDWDEQKQILDIPDPYLTFYLRWSGRLLEE